MFDFFKKENNPRTTLDAAQAIGYKLIVKGYRRIAALYGCAPTAKTTDKAIMEIYTLVTTTFHRAAKQRGEQIPALYDNNIVLCFLKLHEMAPGHLQQHLQYEVEKYLAEGLRADYKQPLELFNPYGDDPDVKRLTELMRATGRQIGEMLPQPKQSFGLPYAKLAEIVLRFSVTTASWLTESSQGITSIKPPDAVCASLFDEVVSYHANLAISVIMCTKGWHGKDSYDAVASEIFAGLSSIILDLPGRSPLQYLSAVTPQNRNRTELYFIRDAGGLDVSDEHILEFAAKHNQQKAVAATPPDQMSLLYCLIRITRILRVHENIDSVVIHYATPVLINGFQGLEKEVSTLIKGV
jgi:hypothetical protein